MSEPSRQNAGASRKKATGKAIKRAKPAIAMSDDTVASLQRANAELQRRLDEALEQQSATAEVLQVINSSPGDLKPVFDAMLERATALCEAAYGQLSTYDGEQFHRAAVHGEPRFAAWLQQKGPFRVLPDTPLGRLLLGERIFHTADAVQDEDYRVSEQYRQMVDRGGLRSTLSAPLRKDGALLGAITVYRQEVRPFTDKQIALLQNFAAQAVIAMENARLINETREALDQQTATAEVLKVINSSPGDLAPVFDAILEKAHTLCGAVDGTLFLRDGERFRAVALRGGVPEPFAERLRQGFVAADVPVSAPLLAGAPFVHIPDLALVDHPMARAGVEVSGTRTLLSVPLRQGDTLLGMIVGGREEVRPFTGKQIALLQNFAAQAVIAMENARLITETQEALEQQTATAEVLGVINSHPGDLAPVFDAMLEKAMRLCGAAFGILNVADGPRLQTASALGVPAAYAEFRRQTPVRPGQPGIAARIRAGEPFVHIVDLKDDDLYRNGDPQRRAMVDLGGARTSLVMGLRRGRDLLGNIQIYRQEVRPYTDKQIALLQNFAAQAVIAIENARLITETREALDQQTATAEVLQVINSSPGDLAPVFEVMLEKAMRLCEAAFGQLATYDGERFHTSATRGVPPAFAEYRRSNPPVYGTGTTPARILEGELVICTDDLKAELAYLSGEPNRRALVDLGGARSALIVALKKDEAVLGFIEIYRQEVRPFSDKQIAPLQNFAAQAVIAMENARLITETREALDQQTATAEVLGVINSSPGDLAPVFDVMLEKAMRLCDAKLGFLSTYDGQLFNAVAMYGVPQAYAAEYFAKPYTPAPGTTHDLIVRGDEVVHITDLTNDPLDNPRRRAVIEMLGVRTILGVALRKEGELVGAFHIYRQEVRPFSDKQIALLRNFAAQAVIAMENARLITETREALEQQTATAEVLGVINSSPGDLVPVFNAILEKSMWLCEAAHGALYEYDGDFARPLAVRAAQSYVGFIQERSEFRPVAGTPLPDALLGKNVVHVMDVRTLEAYRLRPQFHELADRGGIRTTLIVPLRKDDAVLGAIAVYRQEVRPFTDKQIELLCNFAAQAVIAMENARLLGETREALEQQTATAEVLSVINASPGDLGPVFDVILEKAHDLCGVARGSLELYDGKSFYAVAARGLADSFVDQLRLGYPASDNPATRPLIEGQPFSHILDKAEHDFPFTRSASDVVATGTLLCVPLRRDGRLLGMIAAARREVRPFTDKQIALLQNFAAQAVIAMENARLITETREALEQQTATAEVLQVINSSPGDLAPVFDAMLDKATRLSEAAFGILWTHDGERFQAVAFHDVPQAYVEFLGEPQLPSPVAPLGRVARGEAFAHVSDLAAEEYHEQAGLLVRQGLSLGGFRTVLAVPMRKDALLLGAITIYRREVQPFSDKQIALLQNFAAQAVIAMENARLLTETRERTAELQEALEYQTATSDVLKVISGATFDIQPIFETIVTTATRLCEADDAIITSREGDAYRLVSSFAASHEFDAAMQGRLFPADRGSLTGRVALEGQVVHITDITSDPEYTQTETVTLQKNRTMLGVPLLREGVVVGTINLGRTRVQPFTDRQIELVRTFADQAVIALENARLLDEIRQRQAELRVTFDSMADGVVMFDEELRLAAWNRNFQELLGLPEDFFAEPQTYDSFIRYLAERGEYGDLDPRVEIARLRAEFGDHFRFERTRPDGTVIEVRQNPMPDGGFVLIYSDITERKRSEEEIRAARDAAETAYRNLQAAQANLVQAQKMAALGQLTAGIAHEIKNPLNFVNNFASLSVELLDELKETAAPAVAALDEEKRADVDDTMELLTGNLEKIVEHGKRADNIVKSMLEHSRGVSGERREVDLNGVIEEALNLAYHGARAQDQSFNITLERDYAQSLRPIELAPQEMTRVFLNLFGNGFYATTKRAREDGNGSFRPVLTVATRETADAVEVRVRDNGTGISPEIRDKLFQPFFTTKPTGEGTGLGLSISYDIVTQQHGGTITVESEPGVFTEFTIRLPRQ